MHLDGCLKKATSSSKRVRFAAKERIRLVETQYPTYRPAQLRWSNRHLENNWKYAYKKEQQGTAWWLRPEEFSYEECYGDLKQSKNAWRMTIDVADLHMLSCIQVQSNYVYMFQRASEMTGPKRKVA